MALQTEILRRLVLSSLDYRQTMRLVDFIVTAESGKKFTIGKFVLEVWSDIFTIGS